MLRIITGGKPCTFKWVTVSDTDPNQITFTTARYGKTDNIN